MSHFLSARKKYVGEIECLSPLHIGGWAEAGNADQPLVRDGLGLPVIPGSTLAGTVLNFLRQQFPAQATSRTDEDPSDLELIFGYIREKAEQGSGSWIRFEDAHLLAENNGPGETAGDFPEPFSRTGVGIDRVTGTAASRCLYTHELMPVGTKFSFCLVVDTPQYPPQLGSAAGRPAPVDQQELAAIWSAEVDRLIAAALAGFSSQQIRLGAGQNHGWGKVKLDQVKFQEWDFTSRAGLLDWATEATARHEWHPPTPPAPTEQLRVEIAWQPLGPVSAKDSQIFSPSLPLTEARVNTERYLVLPGSSIRGVLRAHAERIINTLGDDRAGAEFDEILRNPKPAVHTIFGAPPDAQNGAWRGALAVDDCYSLNHLETRTWQKLTETPGSPADPKPEKTAAPGPRPAIHPPKRHPASGTDDAAGTAVTSRTDLQEQLLNLAKCYSASRDGTKNADHDRWQYSTHVAIDRWTGGSADGQLFSALEPSAKTKWQPIILNLNTGRIQRRAQSQSDSLSNSAELSLALLLLVLRDLAEGWLTLGFGGTRGRGQIEVKEITFTGDSLEEPWRSLTQAVTLENILNDVPAAIRTAMNVWADRFPPQKG